MRLIQAAHLGTFEIMLITLALLVLWIL